MSGPFASFGQRRPSDALVCTNHVVAGISKSSKQQDERKAERKKSIVGRFSFIFFFAYAVVLDACRHVSQQKFFFRRRLRQPMKNKAILRQYGNGHVDLNIWNRNHLVGITAVSLIHFCILMSSFRQSNGLPSDLVTEKIMKMPDTP